MKAARIDAFTDDAGNIRLVERPLVEPGPGQVRVRMLLSPVNPSDLYFVRGTYIAALRRTIWNQGAPDEGPVYYDPGRTRVCPQPPYGLGGEGVGIVDAAGSGFLARRLLGKRVAISNGPPVGTWQEFSVVDARRVVALPGRLDDEQGAMFFINPMTAYIITREVLCVPRGCWLLLTAAGSALGKGVVRMGRLYGFRTLCVVRSDAAAQAVQRLGADAVVNTTKQDLPAEVHRITGGKGVHYAMDCVGGELAACVVRCMGLGGRLALYGTLANSPLQLVIRDLMMPVAGISGFYLPNWMLQQSSMKMLGIVRQVRRLALRGVFDEPVAATYPLDRVADAVNAAQRPDRGGKILLRIADS